MECETVANWNLRTFLSVYCLERFSIQHLAIGALGYDRKGNCCIGRRGLGIQVVTMQTAVTGSFLKINPLPLLLLQVKNRADKYPARSAVSRHIDVP